MTIGKEVGTHFPAFKVFFDRFFSISKAPLLTVGQPLFIEQPLPLVQLFRAQPPLLLFSSGSGPFLLPCSKKIGRILTWRLFQRHDGLFESFPLLDRIPVDPYALLIFASFGFPASKKG